MNQDNKSPARIALDANLTLTRNTVLLQMAVDEINRAAGMTKILLGNLVERQIDTLPPIDAPDFRLRLVRDILVADTSYQVLLLRLNELFAAIDKVASVQSPHTMVA